MTSNLAGGSFFWRRISAVGAVKDPIGPSFSHEVARWSTSPTPSRKESLVSFRAGGRLGCASRQDAAFRRRVVGLANGACKRCRQSDECEWWYSTVGGDMVHGRMYAVEERRVHRWWKSRFSCGASQS